MTSQSSNLQQLVANMRDLIVAHAPQLPESKRATPVPSTSLLGRVAPEYYSAFTSLRAGTVADLGPLGLPGLWQLTNARKWRPVDDAVYGADVDRCTTDACGRCQLCVERQMYDQNKQEAAAGLLDAMTKLADAGETVRRAIDRIYPDDDNDLDMPGWFDREDLAEHVSLVELHTRAALRIAQAYLAVFPQAEQDSRNGKRKAHRDSTGA